MCYVVKRLATLVFVFAMLLSLTGFTYESNNVDSVNWDFIDGDSDEYSKNAIDFSDLDNLEDTEYYKSLSEDEQFELKNKIGAITNAEITRDQFSKKYALNVPVCTQEKKYYCGPATVQQVLKFGDGQDCTVTQDEIANAIGTTPDGSALSPMVNYIKNNLGNGYVGYQIATNPSLSDMRYMVGSTIYFGYGPCIGRVKFSKGGNWPYTTSGHFLNVSAYDYTSESDLVVRLTDPNIQNVDPTSNGTYWVELEELHTATVTHFAQEFAY